jgi:hypothetical protein
MPIVRALSSANALLANKAKAAITNTVFFIIPPA